MSTVAERVAAGVAWLDEHEPGWEARVVVNELEMESPCRCVLGQVFGDSSHWSGYYYAVGKYGVSWTVSLGFDADATHAAGADDEWTRLQAEWTRVLTERGAA